MGSLTSETRSCANDNDKDLWVMRDGKVEEEELLFELEVEDEVEEGR
jgi:hypothetical protein